MDTIETIRYDRWIEDALKSVVRKALSFCAEKGLPGDHHFYITFSTTHPDVDMPDDLRAQYPEEITIVLEHEFWDLIVEEGYFEVVLSFNEARSNIHVPFEAVTGFADPSVKFGLQFKMEMIDDEDDFEDEFDEDEDHLNTENIQEGASEKDNVIALDTFRNKK